MKKTFKTGCNLPPKKGEKNERRFEAGDPVPDDLTKAELQALKELDAIEEK
jgi:hypothetical protein